MSSATKPTAPITAEAVTSPKPEAVQIEDRVVMTAEMKAEMTKDFERSLEDGRKALTDNDLNNACEKLELASALSVKLFGDFAPETFDPHFYYGKTLLELAATEEKDDGSTLLDDSVTQEDMPLDTTQDKQQGEVKMDENADAKMDESADTSKQDETIEFNPDQTFTEEGEDDDDELETVHSAFESLDYARLVCEKNSDGSHLWLERQKDTFILLSKADLEGGDLANAVGDLYHALSIVDVHFPDNLRDASSVHLELARSYRVGNKFKEANFHIKKSIAAIQKLNDNFQHEPKEGTSLAEIAQIMEELNDEKQLIEVRKREMKELDQKQPAKIDEKPANTIEVKRTEKRAAGDQIESDVDFKKSKIEGAPDTDQA